MGEIGVLEGVRLIERIPNKCYLTIRHEGESYVGCLPFSDPAFCALVGMFLRTQLGRAIEEIGDMDISDIL